MMVRLMRSISGFPFKFGTWSDSEAVLIRDVQGQADTLVEPRERELELAAWSAIARHGLTLEMG